MLELLGSVSVVADMAALIQAMQQDPTLAGSPEMAASPPIDPMMSLGQGAPMDPMMLTPPAPAMPGAGMMGAGAFPSTDPMMLADAVQQTLAQMASQDVQMLEMQQMQAGMAAQPIIDQMLTQAAMPAPMDPMMGGGDPMLAFGEGPMPPMMPEGVMG